MLKKLLSILCKILAPEHLYAIGVVFVWVPMGIHGMIKDKSWILSGRPWFLLFVWFILTLILYPLLMGLVAVLFEKLEKLRKEKHNH